MKIDEWTIIADDIEETIGKDFENGRSKKYFALLKDLEVTKVKTAIQKILSERIYSTIPSVGEIRKAAGPESIKTSGNELDAWPAFSFLFLVCMNYRNWPEGSYDKIMVALKNDRLRKCVAALGVEFVQRIAIDADASQATRSEFGARWAEDITSHANGRTPCQNIADSRNEKSPKNVIMPNRTEKSPMPRLAPANAQIIAHAAL